MNIERIIMFICEDHTVWRKLSMTSKYIKQLIGNHYDHYPRQIKFILNLKATNDKPIEVNNKILDNSLSMHDMLHLIELCRTRDMSFLIDHIIMTDNITNINGKYTIWSYLPISVDSSDGLLLDFDNIWISIRTITRHMCIDANGKKEVISKHKAINFGTLVWNYYHMDNLPEQNKNGYLAWTLFTALINKYN